MTGNNQYPKVIGVKDGFCHIYPDFLLFSDKPESKPSDVGSSSNEGCVMGTFVLLTLFFIYNAFAQLTEAHYFWGILWFLVAGFLAFCAINGRRTKKANVIVRGDLISMKLIRENSFYGASYVEIEYSYSGETKEMHLEFLGYVKKGDPGTRYAIRNLVEEGWLVQEGVAKSGLPYEYYRIEFMKPLVDFYERNPLLFEGSELEEVTKVQEEMQLEFPKSYLEYLSVGGHKNLAMREPVEFFPLSKVKSRTKELRRKLMAIDLEFDQTIPIVAFAFNEGKYLYFRLDGGSDPKIYEVMADESSQNAFDKAGIVAYAFSDYVSENLKKTVN